MPKVRKPKVEYHSQFGEVENFGEKAIEGALALPTSEVSSCNIIAIEELDERVKSMMIKSQNVCQNGKQKAHICQICGKEGHGKDIKDHIEANHLEGVSIPCAFCDKTFKTRNSLRHHRRAFHD